MNQILNHFETTLEPAVLRSWGIGRDWGCCLPLPARRPWLCHSLQSGSGAAPAIPFVSPHADGEWNEHATIVGLWHVNLHCNLR